METTPLQSFQNCSQIFEQHFGTRLRKLVVEYEKTIFPDRRELDICREELHRFLRQIDFSIKDGKLGNIPFDFHEVGKWVMALPARAFPALKPKVAARYGIPEEVRRERLGLDKQQ